MDDIENCNQNLNNVAENNKSRGGKAPPLIENGAIIGVTHLFRIERLIGGGGFGQIFAADDLETGVVVAVKVEPKAKDAARLVLELNVLRLLKGVVHIPNIFYSGETGSCNFFIMQLLGKNLQELRKRKRNKRFSTLTCARIGVQVVEAIRSIHKTGFIHRDIKPGNICVGIGENRKIIYVVDFGMARQMKNPDGTFRKERTYASFRGTARYVSLNVHERRDPGWVDDLWCLYYALLEMSEGALPWRCMTDQDEICRMKFKLNHVEFSKKMGKSFAIFPEELSKRTRTEQPDYTKLINCLKECTSTFDACSEFEWTDEQSTEQSI